jgi:hypothetical protein
MPKIIHRKKEAFLSAGGLLVAAGGVILKVWTHSAAIYVGGAVSFFGLLLLLYGAFGFATSSTTILDDWDAELLKRALNEATPASTISILQTSIPDVTQLIGWLEDLLTTKQKHFRLRILLLDHQEAAALISARVKLRPDSAEAHLAEIRANIELFIRLKERVDQEWAESSNGAKLDLQIRLYSFLPFGSVIQIGEKVIFSGLFWNWTSSVNGPMIRITDPSCKNWKCYTKQFCSGWVAAKVVFPASENVVPAKVEGNPELQAIA